MPTISAGRLAVILGSLVALGPLAIDTYLPALLTMAGHFQVPIHDVEISVSVYVMGVAAGQWLGGPFSDQFGRKPVAYGGLLLFVAGSLMIPFSADVQQLYVLRFLQALGGGATAVIAAASVRDHFSGKEAARVLTTIGLVMLLAPLLAPAIGSLLLSTAGWESIFYMLAIYGMMLGLVVAFMLPTVSAQGGNEPLRKRLFTSYGRVVRERRAMGFILANALSFSAMFTFITDAAFLYMDYFGLSAAQFPIAFGANVVTMLALNRLNVILLRYYETAAIMRAGLIIQSVAAMVLLLLSLSGWLTLWMVIPLVMVVCGMMALVMPNGIACFLSLFERDSGAATGLNGTLQFLMAGVVGAALGSFHNGTPLPMTLLMTMASVSALMLFLLLTREEPRS
ncbi:multidrug effflux MFS transporter [Alcanivorax sediminis]|uniref:Bcr/CflA family efflux transporter n=1 Tax=Alcanivorax sediminis TaxID=2663008 RepID=A0A6N7LUQ3_9GAMM|nr:multidrug effflux MFS transporter [Alcanivorax sediminis]MQX54023.1 Bcr/CflA family efflux MFS transporter [Alcanivorax sediminis]